MQLTLTQEDVLKAVNDYCEIHGRMNVGAGELPLPDLLADLGMPEQEVWQALADLHALGLIKGTAGSVALDPVGGVDRAPVAARRGPAGSGRFRLRDAPRKGPGAPTRGRAD